MGKKDGPDAEEGEASTTARGGEAADAAVDVDASGESVNDANSIAEASPEADGAVELEASAESSGDANEIVAASTEAEDGAIQAQVVGPHPSDVGVAQHISDKFATVGPDVIHTEGAFFVWTGTHWRRAGRRETFEWVMKYDGLGGTLKLTNARIESILKILAVILEAPDFFEDRPRGINAANGFVDLTGQRPRLLPHDPSQAQDFVLRGRWLPDEPFAAPLLRMLLHGCFRDDADAGRKVVLLRELAGAVAAGLGTDLRDPAAFLFVGDGANGKSQVLDALRGLVPDEAVSSIPVTDFGHDRYRVQLAGKRLNVAAELGVARSVASDKFKSVITGDVISAREIRQPVATFRPRAVHVFATNTLPQFDSGMPPSVARRLIVVPFNRLIPKNERVALLGQRIAIEEADALVTAAVRGAVRLIRRSRYSVTPSAKRALREWIEEADPVEGFLADGWAQHVAGSFYATRDVYLHFVAYCSTEGITRVPSLKPFITRLLATGRGFEKKRTASRRFVNHIVLNGFPKSLETLSPSQRR
jgi:P4 family phage/plasmid primase-like protien